MYGGKDLWNKFVLSLEWKKEGRKNTNVFTATVTGLTANDHVKDCVGEGSRPLGLPQRRLDGRNRKF